MASSSLPALRLLNYNCFLVPSGFRKMKVNSLCRHASIRAHEIGVLAKDFDVVTLQEVWGSHVDKLIKPLSASHYIPWGRGSWNLLGRMFSLQSEALALIDTVQFFLKKTGGLYLTHKKTISLLYSAKHTFSIGEKLTQKGVQVALLDVDMYWPGKFLLMFNTHLTPFNIDENFEQQREIAKFIASTIAQLHERKQRRLLPDNFSFEQCGVIITGHFNIDAASTSSYHHILRTLRARDLYAEVLQRTGAAEETTYDSRNSFFPWGDGGARIDYILAVDQLPLGLSETSPRRGTDKSGAAMQNSEVRFMRLECRQFDVIVQPCGEELSDHWGLAAEIVPADSAERGP